MLLDYTKVRKVSLNKKNQAFHRTFPDPPKAENWYRGHDIHGNEEFLTAVNYETACVKFERKFPECWTRAGSNEILVRTKRDWSADVG